MSSKRPQNLSTFASSSGASTSSSTQIGEGFVKNTAKIRDNAVSACPHQITMTLTEVFYLVDLPSFQALLQVDHQSL